MRIRLYVTVVVCLLVSFVGIESVSAQYGVPRRTDPATGETYHVELFAGLWKSTPEIVISSESLGIPGTDIDFVSDLGIQAKRFGELRLFLRPAPKHRFRLQYVPIKYDAEAVLNRSLVFNGIRYDLGLPVTSTLTLRTWRVGYEYDFLYRDRFFAGLLAEVKYTHVETSLSSLLGTEFASARAPIPAIGGIVRVYPIPNIAITGEVSGFKLPSDIDADYQGRYLDWDISGVINFSDNVGFQAGYRSVDIRYLVERDAGHVEFKGTYSGWSEGSDLPEETLEETEQTGISHREAEERRNNLKLALQKLRRLARKEESTPFLCVSA